MRQSRRDSARWIDCGLQNETVAYGIYRGVSGNRTRWFDIEHGRAEIGHDPHDGSE